MKKESINENKISPQIEENQKTAKKQTEKPKRKIVKRIFITISILLILGLATLLFLLYGPWNGFRDWLITTAMTTQSHQYIATLFYSDEAIQASLDRNRIIQVTGYTDESLIQFVNYDNMKNIKYANEYERQILEKDENNNDYKIIKIDEGNKYSGYMSVIYDPSRIELVAASEYGESRYYLTEFAEKTNALVAINAGGFEGTIDDSAYLGITISNNKLVSASQSANIIGFNENHKLILGNFSSESAISNNIRDCITFSPYLLINGQKSEVLGNGGWGKAARTAIGQRADGIVLFIVLNGNRIKGNGATMQDLIEIFERYGAINAANLDGGTSTTMTVHDKAITRSTVSEVLSEMIRPIPTAFILRPDDSDDGDYSAVKDLVDK